METLTPLDPKGPLNLLRQWQSQRRLTRQLIDAFPEDELFEYKLGGMPSFAEMVMDLLGVTVPGLWGILTGEWKVIQNLARQEHRVLPATKKSILWRWDQATELINTLWSQIPAKRFQETDRAFGSAEKRIELLILEWMDNEMLQRAQAFVYLSALGIKPGAMETAEPKKRAVKVEWPLFAVSI